MEFSNSMKMTPHFFSLARFEADIKVKVITFEKKQRLFRKYFNSKTKKGKKEEKKKSRRKGEKKRITYRWNCSLEKTAIKS